MGDPNALYGAIRGWWTVAQHTLAAAGAGAAAPAAPEPVVDNQHLARTTLRLVRDFGASMLFSHFITDMLLSAVLAGLILALLLGIFGNCRQLGCACVKISLYACLAIASAFWLLTLAQLSDEEYHDSYVSFSGWVLDALFKVRVK